MIFRDNVRELNKVLKETNMPYDELEIIEQVYLTRDNPGEMWRACLGCLNRIVNREFYGPRHKPSANCESGGHPHCTCDTCF